MQLLGWKPHYCLVWALMAAAPACVARGAQALVEEVDVGAGASVVVVLHWVVASPPAPPPLEAQPELGSALALELAAVLLGD